MQVAAFNAVCPFEIGDKVYVLGQRMASWPGELPTNEKAKTITDIATVHFLKNGGIEFLYEFDNSGKYERIALQKSNKGVHRQ